MLPENKSLLCKISTVWYHPAVPIPNFLPANKSCSPTSNRGTREIAQETSHTTVMSLPPELRVLCFQLSSTLPADLPPLVPTLLRHVSRCQVPLSSPAGSSSSADASASSVLVHKLKTHLSSLLSGKSPEGRFTAVVLIKAVVDVGGWEILQGAEAWVRGLLSILGVGPLSKCSIGLC